eukprot:1987172-Amphidinium_carterae.1
MLPSHFSQCFTFVHELEPYLQRVPDKILELLSASKGNILDDEDLRRPSMCMKSYSADAWCCTLGEVVVVCVCVRVQQELINTLASSKLTSQRIEERVKEQEKTQALHEFPTGDVLKETRESYVPVAVRASAMFFVIADLSVVEPMYQYSLEWFSDVYTRHVVGCD